MEEIDKLYSDESAHWEVDRNNPVEPLQCVVVGENGERCRYAAIPGQNRCLKHGADRATADQIVSAARNRLLGLTHTAIETFEDVMVNSINDSARIKAASEVLNRAGVKEDVQVNVTVEDKSMVREDIYKKLEAMRLEDLEQGEEIEDAEVIDE